MNNVLGALLGELQMRPVLFHIGATDRPPEVWDPIAGYSVYVGIGPEADPRQSSSKFHRAVVLDRVISCSDADQVTVHLTKNRIFSSLRHPNARVVSEFADFGCEPDGELSAKSATVDSVLEQLSLPTLDWFYTNVNGLDMEIWRSVSDHVQSRILAVNTCLDFIELHSGQEISIAAHREFTDAGFWLSWLVPSGAIRMRKNSLQRLNAIHDDINERLLRAHHRRTPGWVFVRFLRTVDSMDGDEFSPRDYVVLWSFALLDRQIGFAADVAFTYERRFGADKVFDAMLAETVRRMHALKPGTARRLAGRLLPRPIRRGIKRLLQGLLYN